MPSTELRFLRAPLRRKLQFKVMGLSPAAYQPAPVMTQNVDLRFEDLNNGSDSA